MAASAKSFNIDISKLIVEVQNRSPLYDTSTPDYHARKLKKKLWKEVCREIYSASVWNGLSVGEQAILSKF
jgi:hypothetical protein